jgi:ankyrin repeat protein
MRGLGMKKSIILCMAAFVLSCTQVQCAADGVDDDNDAALVIAVFGNNYQQVSESLKRGADPAKKDKFGSTAFHHATNNPKILSFLCKNSPHSADVKNKEGSTPLHYTITRNERYVLETVRLLLASGADPALQNKKGETAFHLALDKPDILILLCKKKPQLINVENSEGKSPLSSAALHENIKAVTILLEAGADLALLANYSKTCAMVVRDICNSLTLPINQDATIVEKKLFILKRFMNDTFKNTLIQLDDKDDDSPNKQKLPVPLFIQNNISLLLWATETSESIKKRLANFMQTTIVDPAGVPLQNLYKVADYCTRLEAEWKQSKSFLEGAGLKAPSADEIAAVLVKLPKPDPTKLNVTVISLPTLLQTADVAGYLYKEATDSNRAWANTCAFYATFHLVNAWRNRNNAVEMLKSLSRNNFSEFLGLMQSAFDVGLQLQKTASTEGDAYVDFRSRQQFYPTILINLMKASSLHLGGIYSDKITALTTAYTFLSQKKEQVADESVLQYCPHYVLKDNTMSYFHYHENRENVEQFHDAPELLYYLQSVKSRFVFPLIISTPAHGSAALVYKFVEPIVGDAGEVQAQYIVFFAESNRLSGHEDHPQSDKGESFDFKTVFTKLFAKLVNRPDGDVLVQGPTDELTVREKACLVQAIYNKFQKEKGSSFVFQPGVVDMKKITDHYNPTELLRLTVEQSSNTQKIRKLLEIGAHTDVKTSIGMTIFHAAIIADNINMLTIACQQGLPGIDIPVENSGKTPLMLAVEFGQDAIVQLLFDAGADVSCQDVQGNTVFHSALKRPDNKILELLCKLTRGRTAINIPNANGKTPLMLALEARKYATVQVLLATDADASCKDLAGDTVFHSAVKYADNKMLELLCKSTRARAAINIPNANGKTPLDIAGPDLEGLLEGFGAVRTDVPARHAQPRSLFESLRGWLGG